MYILQAKVIGQKGVAIMCVFYMPKGTSKTGLIFNILVKSSILHHRVSYTYQLFKQFISQ